MIGRQKDSIKNIVFFEICVRWLTDSKDNR